MAPHEHLRSILSEGRCTMGPGRAFDVAILVLEEPRLDRQLMECLWDEDEGVAGRAADALETVVSERPAILKPWKDALLGLLVETRSLKMRWYLGQTVLRLKLSRPECKRLADLYTSWLDDRSSIVKTCAMQGLAELTRQDTSMTAEVTDLIRHLTRSGTPAMRARGRHLLAKLEKGGDLTWVRVRQQQRQAARLTVPRAPSTPRPAL